MKVEQLERELRSLKPGSAFSHTELLDMDWALDTTWSVVQAVQAASSQPMSPGTSACRAYVLLLRAVDDPTPWGFVATFCDDRGALYAETRRGESRAITWPLRAHVEESEIDLQASFIDAIDAEHPVLWIREKSWPRSGAYLCAMEYAYRRDGRALRKVLQAVGADPASYADKGDDFNKVQAAEVRGSYEAGFTGAAHPRQFHTQHLYRGRPAEVVYTFNPVANAYEPDPLE